MRRRTEVGPQARRERWPCGSAIWPLPECWRFLASDSDGRHGKNGSTYRKSGRAALCHNVSPGRTCISDRMDGVSRLPHRPSAPAFSPSAGSYFADPGNSGLLKTDSPSLIQPFLSWIRTPFFVPPAQSPLILPRFGYGKDLWIQLSKSPRVLYNRPGAKNGFGRTGRPSRR